MTFNLQLLEESRLDDKVKEDGYSQVLEGAKLHYEEKAKVRNTQIFYPMLTVNDSSWPISFPSNCNK